MLVRIWIELETHPPDHTQPWKSKPTIKQIYNYIFFHPKTKDIYIYLYIILYIFLGGGSLGHFFILQTPANTLAIFESSPRQPRYATDDAVRVGRLHVDTDGWEEAQLGGGCRGGKFSTASPWFTWLSWSPMILFAKRCLNLLLDF